MKWPPGPQEINHRTRASDSSNARTSPEVRAYTLVVPYRVGNEFSRVCA